MIRNDRLSRRCRLSYATYEGVPMSNIINIPGFQFDASEGRAWNAMVTLGLVREEDGRLRLLDDLGYPSTSPWTTNMRRTTAPGKC